jgi:predicted dehydrogenase
MSRPLTFAALGIDHNHIFAMARNLQDVGARFVGWWTDGEPLTQREFVSKFPDVPRRESVEAILADPSIDLILSSAIPSARTALAIAAMQAGKDVMVDKPGCTTLEELAALKACVAQTGRIWTVNFSERFEVRAMTRAAELIAQGAIGKVVQTLGIGPHRLNAHLRPDWFFQRPAFGGILTDIGSHQIDQFLFLTGSGDADIELARAENLGHPERPDFHDFGEIVLSSGGARGYIRVDWFTPDALPIWGDGRLMIMGTQGTIEVRKYVDVGGQPGGDHLVLVNGTRCERIDCTYAGLPYFSRLVDDIANRTQSAVPQAHSFKVMELSIRAQALAEGVSL